MAKDLRNRRVAFMAEDGNTRIVIEHESKRVTIQKPTPNGNWMACDRYTITPDRNPSMKGESAWLGGKSP